MPDHAVPASRLAVYVDITDTVRSRWRAGIQRVVCQLVRHLGEDDRIELIPIVWSDELAGYRHAQLAESARLLEARSPGVAAVTPDAPSAGASTGGSDSTTVVSTVRDRGATIARSGGGAARRVALWVLETTRTKALVRDLVRRALLVTRDRRLIPLEVGRLRPGSVLFDIDAVWNVVQADRAELYSELSDSGVGVAALVYDVIPIDHPEWFEAEMVSVFARTLEAQARGADLVLAISEYTADRFLATAAVGTKRPAVIGLGSDVVELGAQRPTLPAGLVGTAFVLVVGTIEPRKNHGVLLDAFERLEGEFPDAQLVVVGRAGWVNDDLQDRLSRQLRDDPRIHWVDGVDDSTLAALYEAATVVAVPSITEGYGLPVIEALRHGTPVVSSTGGALPEAAAGTADLVGPNDLDGWVDALALHLGPTDHNALARRRAASFTSRTWPETAEQVADALVGRFARTATSRTRAVDVGTST